MYTPYTLPHTHRVGAGGMGQGAALTTGMWGVIGDGHKMVRNCHGWGDH